MKQPKVLTDKTKIKAINSLIENKMSTTVILSFDDFTAVRSSFTHKMISSCDKFAIWGVFAIGEKIACLYSQDKNGKMEFFKPN